MKTINATIGYRELHDDGTIIYHGGRSSEGEIYLDLGAWNSGEGVIYISEGALFDNDFSDLWTRETWLAWVAEDLANRFDIHDSKYVENVAEDILYETQEYGWADLATYLDQYETMDYE